MSSGRDEGPVYYREIQKNAYLKRIPTESGTSKLRPLGHKKPSLKPMWTLFCVHNGRTPFLEQYPEPESAATLAHRPLWRACLRTARHVTASVKPHAGDEYDFLVDTDHGPVRMLAPDWDSMQDWVNILRAKLHELKIVSRGENVYGAPPVALPVRAPARDPMSPLPPTPPVPPDRVPGIELAPIRSTVELPNDREPPNPTTPTITPSPNIVEPPNPVMTPTPLRPTNSFNIDLNDEEVDISDWDDVPVTPSTSQDKRENKSVTKICGQNICLDDSILKRTVTDSDEEFFTEMDNSVRENFKQCLVVNNGENSTHENQGSSQSTNITVIQVSNKGPPHTAIPVIGNEENVFDFNFKQNLKITEQNEFVNIVNTENESQKYGSIFDKPESDYGHISLTTTVTLTHNANEAPVSLTSLNVTPVNVAPVVAPVSVTPVNVTPISDGVYERLCMASTSQSPLPIRRVLSIDKVRKSSLPNLDLSESTYECLFPNSSQNERVETRNGGITERLDGQANRSLTNGIERSEVRTETNRNAINGRIDMNRVLVNIDSNQRGIRSNIERSQSQNAYDIAPRRRDVVQNFSPKREVKVEKAETSQPKPIWKRGLTELSLLSRLRGIGQKRQESPTRITNEDRSATSPAKVVHRSRQMTRADSGRRRSNSLSSTGQSPAGAALQPLRARQAAALRAEQRRGACIPATAHTRDPPLLTDYDNQVWVARWGCGGARWGGRAGDRLAALAATTPRSAHHAALLLKAARTPRVDILFHRVPLGKIYVIAKKDHEALGIKIDNECTIVSVEAESPASRAGLPPPGKWTVTEVNNRPINLVKGGQEEVYRLGMHGTEVSVLIQPTALARKIRAALKGNKPLLGFR